MRFLRIFAVLCVVSIPACSTPRRARSPDRCMTAFKHPGLRAFCVAAAHAHPVSGAKHRVRRPPDTPQGLRLVGCDDPRPCRLALAARAKEITARPRWRVGDQRFRRDCVGFVQTVLVAEGFPLKEYRPRAIPGQDGGGVRLLWRMADKYGMLHRRKIPEPGDIIFFDDTHDRNKNGRLDDPLTHVGMVVDIDRDGTINFAHKGSGPVKIRQMNLFRPGERRDPKTKKVLNSYVRRPGYAGDEKRLAGELFRAFATVHL